MSKTEGATSFGVEAVVDEVPPRGVEGPLNAARARGVDPREGGPLGVEGPVEVKYLTVDCPVMLFLAVTAPSVTLRVVDPTDPRRGVEDPTEAHLGVEGPVEDVLEPSVSAAVVKCSSR